MQRDVSCLLLFDVLRVASAHTVRRHRQTVCARLPCKAADVHACERTLTCQQACWSQGIVAAGCDISVPCTRVWKHNTYVHFDVQRGEACEVVQCHAEEVAIELASWVQRVDLQRLQAAKAPQAPQSQAVQAAAAAQVWLCMCDIAPYTAAYLASTVPPLDMTLDWSD